MAKTIQQIEIEIPFTHPGQTLYDIAVYIADEMDNEEILNGFPFRNPGQTIQAIIDFLDDTQLADDFRFVNEGRIIRALLSTLDGETPTGPAFQFPAEFLAVVTPDYTVYGSGLGGYFSNYPYTTKCPSGTEYYVTKSGNDTTGNGSQAAPFRTLQKAKTEGADIIRIGGGLWNQADGFDAGFNTSKSMGLRAIPGELPIVTRALNNPSFSLDSGNVYVASGVTGISGIVDRTYVRTSGEAYLLIDGETGVPIPFSIAANKAACESTEYSYYDDGTDLYVHFAGGAAPNHNNVVIMSSDNLFAITSADDKTMYVEGIEFWGVHPFAWSNGQNADESLLVGVDCGFRFSRDMNSDGNDGDCMDLEGLKLRLLRCHYTDCYNKDGMNLTRNPTGDNYNSDSLEEACIGARNGERVGSGNTFNNTTVHNESRYVRLSCRMHGSRGANYGDVQASFGVNLGCWGGGSLAGEAGTPADFRATGASSGWEGAIWYKDCVGESTHGFSRGTGMHMMKLSGNTGTTSGTQVDATVQANVDAIFIPKNTVAPAISGLPEIDEVITGDDGTWTGLGNITFAYQHQSSDDDTSFSNISGATSEDYTITSGEDDKYFRRGVVASTGTRDNPTRFNSVTAYSDSIGPIGAAATAPVNTVAPVISGNPMVGQTLSCTTGTWTGTPTITYAYQWLADAVAITGATSSTYLLTEDEIGADITCEVGATNVVGSDTALSNSLGPVEEASNLNAAAIAYESAIIADGGTITPTKLQALSDLLDAFDSNSFTSRIKHFQLLSGIGGITTNTELANCLANLVLGASSPTLNNFTTSEYTETDGLIGDGSTMYIDTGYNWGSGKQGCNVMLGANKATWTNAQRLFGNYSGTDTIEGLVVTSGGNQIRGSFWRTPSTAVSATSSGAGNLVNGTRCNLNFVAKLNGGGTDIDLNVYKDGTSIASNVLGGTTLRTPDSSIELFRSSINYFSGRLYYALICDDGWSSAEVATLEGLMETFLTSWLA